MTLGTFLQTTYFPAHTRLHEGIARLHFYTCDVLPTIRLLSGALLGLKIGTVPFELMNTTLKTVHCTRTCVSQHVR